MVVFVQNTGVLHRLAASLIMHVCVCTCVCVCVCVCVFMCVGIVVCASLHVFHLNMRMRTTPVYTLIRRINLRT